ncbi:MAG: D-glycero-beta-D-manno-heptose 1-phosphate adenylyltransferase [Bacteroidetes bacterium]|nr:D-glycero-beta-D-manno-heptose 1-phosphate adenylyltransferase [Bacteroidota bacterium]
MIVTLKELKNIRSELRLNSLKVVFTNGVFDIIHRGHVEYLQKAKSLGNVLVVGLNSDASVRRIKGDKRPIVNQDDRAFVLSNLLMVDYVCLFEEDTPLQLISELVPDVLVKGSDWDINDIVGRDVVEKNGGKVETIEFVPERSSTNIVDTIINRYCKGQ